LLSSRRISFNGSNFEDQLNLFVFLQVAFSPFHFIWISRTSYINLTLFLFLESLN